MKLQEISGDISHFKRFQEISRDFRRFQEISGDFRRFQEISGNFRKFQEISGAVDTVCQTFESMISPNRHTAVFLKQKEVSSYCILPERHQSLWMTTNTCGIHQCMVSKTIIEVCEVIFVYPWSNWPEE